MHAGIVRISKQRGAFIVTVCLMLFFLLGFIGIALDFGRLFIVKTELQTATDACALAAAQELDRQPDALVRATNAGLAAGNANGVVMQSGNWNGRGRLNANNLSFRDANHTLTTTPDQARYARCEHTQRATATPLLRMLAVFGNNAVADAGADVFARAEATLAPSQSTCPLPLALKPRLPGVKPDYGFVKGEWLTLLSKGSATNGQIGWANLDGSNNASETEAELKGYCGTRVNDQLGTPGVQQSVADVWNARFGIYKNNSGPDRAQPDYTGYVYTAKNHAPGRNALADFQAKRLAFAACAASLAACETATGIKLNSFQSLATPGSGGELRRYGGNRRIAPVPVVNGANKVVDFACMLMLQPVPSPMADVQLEYLGNASEPGSPCIASGLPGGSAGPLVPVLVL
ncbi:pilus assembly protein TadG-related protein [Massilia sp. BHUDP2]|uniref:pilus assembly protein TadG-related protein n=1 Tax=Massilia sp. BHUDP2 TaxID=3034505 RepID=UPI003905BC87